MWVISFSSPFVENKNGLSPLDGFGNLVENHLNAYARIYFWVLYSDPFVYVHVLFLLSHFLNSVLYNFVISFGIGKCYSYIFLLFFQDFNLERSPLKIILTIHCSLRLYINFLMGLCVVFFAKKKKKVA